jgi:hypothetical protein
VDKVTGGSKVGVALLLVGSVGAIGVACYLYLTHGLGVLSAINEGSMYVHVDFWIWWSSANALFEGGSVYHGTGAPARSLNAPIRTVLISPVALLEPLVAYRAFVLLSVATAVGYLPWTATLIGVLVVGPYATFVEYPKVLSSVRPDGNPVNASLPGAAARIF